MTMLSILFGGVVGLSLGLTGGGGAIFAVPMLAYGMGLPARESVTISLVSVGFTSFIGFLGKWRKGQAEIRTGLLFAIAGMIGAPIGSWIAGRIPEAILMLLFAALMLTIAVKMWRQGSRSNAEAKICVPVERCEDLSHDYTKDGPSCQRDISGNLILSSRCARLLLLIGVAAGVLSGMFGVGGGFIIVPALVVFSGMSMSRALGTSLMVIALVSVSGITAQVSAGQQLNMQTTLLFVVGGLTGLWIGQSISHRLSSAMLQRTFSIAILLVAIFVIFKNVSQG
ncbi:MAG: sulfite exporter TauE/SafE family protein [Planctomycetaceae bacterium]